MTTVVIDENEKLTVQIRLQNGTIITVNTTAIILAREFGYPTRCNRCNRIGTPIVAGSQCGMFGTCDGIMEEVK